MFSNIIGKSAPMHEIFNTIRMVSKTHANILIVGESGTGKELVARAIHYDSNRAEKLFVTIDCAAIPSEIMESELFGHEKGLFTGAHERKTGLLELAHEKGEIFDQMNLLDTEKRLIIKALTQTGWNQSKAAVILGISRKQLMTKMKNHEITAG